MTAGGAVAGFLFTIALLAGGALPAAAAQRAAEAKADLRELRARIEALQKRLAGAEEFKSEAVDALKDSERAISDARRNLRELAQQSEAAAKHLAGLRAESRARESALGSQRELLSRLLRQLHAGGQLEPLRLLLNQGDPSHIARQIHYFGYISRARSAKIDEMRANLARLEELAREAGRRTAELEALAAAQSAQQQRLELERQSRARALAGISREIRQQQLEMSALKRNETRLSRLVEQLGRVIARKPGPPRLRNERVPDAAHDGSPFEQLKGRLSLPVRGELGNHFGSPRSDGGPAWKGLFIAARAGEEVRAIAAGTVVFADWLRGFGNLLIIDHGEAYMSLYAYNEALFKRVGDAIRGGDPIAVVGNSGGNADSGLYFEVRHQGKPLDPLNWVIVR